MDNKLTFNVAAYYMDYTDQQQNRNGLFPGESTIINADDVAGRGLEMDMTYQPIQGLMLTASAGYSKVLKEPGPESAGRPEWSGSLAAQYDFALSDGVDAFVRADMNYRSAFYSTRQHIFNNSDTTLVNARAGIEMDSWELYVWGRNLTDEEVFSNTSFNGVNGGINSNMEPPRTYGVGAKLTF